MFFNPAVIYYMCSELIFHDHIETHSYLNSAEKVEVMRCCCHLKKGKPVSARKKKIISLNWLIGNFYFLVQIQVR